MGRTTTAVEPVEQGTLAVSSEARLEQFGRMLTSIPMREGDPDGVLLDILSATSPDDWDKQAEKLPSTKDMIGRQLHVIRIERGESELNPEQPYFLFLHCVDRNGEPFLVTTGAPSIMARLVMLHHWGKLPAIVEPIEVGKAKDGKSRPLDLRIHATNG